MNKNVLFALGAAALFGASTPFAKLLTADMPPVVYVTQPGRLGM